MSYKHVGTAGDLVRFGCSLKVECTACGAARTLNGVEVYNALRFEEAARLYKRLQALQEKGSQADRPAACLSILRHRAEGRDCEAIPSFCRRDAEGRPTTSEAGSIDVTNLLRDGWHPY